MAIRHALVIAAPIAIVGVAITVLSQKHLHEDVLISIRHDAVPIEVPAPPPAPEVFVSLTRLQDDEIASQGFTLSQTQDIRVYALGEGTSGGMVDFGWIMNASTRQPVWQMTYGDTKRAGGATKNRVANEVVTLDAGNYIVYYMTDGSHSYDDWNSRAPKHERFWGITLSTADGIVAGDVVSDYSGISDPAIIAQLIHIRDDANRRQAFSLESESEVRIYALGEGESGDMYDFAWIEDAKSGQDIWEMTYNVTEHAGGARKNRVFDGTIVLPAGEYVLRYEADGSHSFESWNMTPPRDPFSYGVTLLRVGN